MLPFGMLLLAMVGMGPPGTALGEVAFAAASSTTRALPLMVPPTALPQIFLVALGMDGRKTRRRYCRKRSSAQNAMGAKPLSDAGY